MLSSRFASVLDTNYAPSSMERVEIESLLHGPEERLRVLEAEISKLQVETEELRQYIVRYRALLSPFRRLPADLWGEIFVHSLPSNEYNLPGRTLKDAPLFLTTICRTWRDIAIKTPRLWNSIHIYFPRYLSRIPIHQIPPILDARKDGVKAWLDRSGSLPITCSIAIGPDSRTRRPENSTALATEKREVDTSLASAFTHLAQYSRRCKAIRLSVEGNDLSPMVWKSFSGLTWSDLPLLQAVCMDGVALCNRMHGQHGQATSLTPIPLIHMAGTPSVLRRLSILAPCNPEKLLGLTIEWSAMTDLRIAPSTYHSRSSYTTDPPVLIARLVESCPNLSSLSLHLVVRQHPQQQSAHPEATTLQWKFLRTLDMKFEEEYLGDRKFSETLAETFRRLRTPALERLTINAAPRYEPPRSRYVGSAMPFHDMIVQSHSPIAHLGLDTFFLSSTEALSRTFQSLPFLKSFRFSSSTAFVIVIPDDDDDTEDEDVHTLNATLLSLCPPSDVCTTLEKLDLVDCKVGHIDAIITFATAVSSLKDLSVKFKFRVEEESVKLQQAMFSTRVREAVAYLREVRGMQVVWKWRNDSRDFSLMDDPYDGLEPLGRLPYESL